MRTPGRRIMSFVPRRHDVLTSTERVPENIADLQPWITLRITARITDINIAFMATVFVAVEVNENSLESMEISHGFKSELSDFLPGHRNRFATFWTVVSHPSIVWTEYLVCWVQLNPF
jgi:hypothetical protein